MKKLGQTATGNILVEMTSAEWDQICPDDLLKWKSEMKRKIWNLNLHPMTRNVLLRGIGWETNFIPDSYAFMRDGRLLSFAEWCKWIQTYEGEINIKRLRNFGKKSYENLIESIKVL